MTGSLADVRGGGGPAAASPRARLADMDAQLAERYWQRAQVLELIEARTAFMDALLLELWDASIDTDELALYALGGYGRGELLPHSDLDLLIVGRRPDRHAAAIETFLLKLYDLHQDVGQSVRALKEVRTAAAGDITIATALFERRPLRTTEAIDRKLNEALQHKRLWPAEAFYHAKLDEQRKRHATYADTEYGLEPNVKESPGGLRDLHTAMWVCARQFGTSDPDALEELGVLTSQEREWLLAGRRYLLWVRWGLHLLCGRKEERLQFEHQRGLAERLGYVDTTARRGVERYMQQYYRHVLTLRELNDILLQFFDETIVRRRSRNRVIPINERFQLRDDYIEACADDVFQRRPSALMEIFVLLAGRRDVAGVRASTIRAIREALPLIDDDFRNDPDNTGLFLDLLRAPYTLVSQLTRMRRYGVLQRYIPEYGRVIGQMQHDLFHVYTVDAHTMQIIRNMRRFRYRSAEKEFPVAAHCVRNIAKVELLYIAGLYHDIGKGRGGDHSALGARDAGAFCTRHGLSRSDTELVVWLVDAHLLMSSTAQRKDIYDPDVIHEFARQVKSERRLNYLYALTVADINATNPTLWNSWRATLLRQLYSETRRALRRGLESPLDREDALTETRSWAMERLGQQGLNVAEVHRVWDIFGEDFFLRHTPREIADLTARVHGHDLAAGPLILVRDMGQQLSEGGATQIYIHMQDQPEIFAATTITLDQFSLSVFEANLSTGASGECFNRFVVLDDDGNRVAASKALWREVRERLETALADPGAVRRRSQQRLPRRAKQLARPTSVSVRTSAQAETTEITIAASDRPGLLSDIASLLAEQQLSVVAARIMTLGERAEDTFEVTGADGQPLRDQQRLYELENHLRQELDRSLGQGQRP
ncbi:MAG: [protein-PII] uridylyltransferase [Pseudomonadota bacterium]